MPTVGATARISPSTPVDFESLFEQCFDYVARTLRFLGVRQNDIEDVGHDVFLHVYSHLGDYDPARPLKPWIYCFAFRIARDYRQCARHRETAVSNFSLDVAHSPGPDTLALHQELQLLALRALDSLSLEERDVFVAMVLDELTAPETAELLGVPRNTVYSRLRRARTNFDSAIKRLGLNVGVP